MESELNIEESIDNGSMDVEDRMMKRCRLPRRQTVQSKKFCAKDERNASLKKVSVILQKSETDRTFEEAQVLTECSEAVEEVQLRWRKRDEAKRRLEEFEEPPEVLREKCLILAQAIAQSQHLVVYTGAGISTAAKIPDYRGPNGIWTRLQQGKDIGAHDLSLAEPTYTHMALSELYRKKILKYVVSQNCDGLHLRSGLPRTALSELHGNMYIEVCKTCKPHKEYWRLFDVTENTARYSHKTSRKCYLCNEPLIDTIVHFGERGSLLWPLNWAGACKNAEKATTIICLGSSLKVLKKYPWLWQMDKPAKKRPNLYIVNLQWTPKDDVANVKIHGKCDKVMETIMNMLDIQVPPYEKYKDPIFAHGTPLCESEFHTTNQPLLKLEDDVKTEEKHDFPVQNGIKDCLINSDNDLSSIKTIKSDLCDTSSNSDKSSPSHSENTVDNCLPMKKEVTNAFSIDEILNDRVHTSYANSTLPRHDTPSPLDNNFLLTPNCSVLGYNHFTTNLLQYQILGTYSDFIYYPYQTSFLYPGLHSIINPIPDFTIADDKTEDASPKIEPSCDFCDKNFNSVNCLFYPKTQPVFINQQCRYSKSEQKQKPNVCVCCDYSTDEEDVELNENKEQNGEKEQLRNKIQAGWFGKGCKKNRRWKKK
ncbi:NAD-dependent protein deacetylase sirtuin-7 [Asbolus verrucosus]|uniref:protein acetyllysine N-acetyltransferase n=1 Tax=Asbolus verrucosus TaxID=1661398 RepID=A0A482VJU7_ASBVE|nr:NAD-dependent protein deacetylase sirtuin-7 [Asbolus verrucosus]